MTVLGYEKVILDEMIRLEKTRPKTQKAWECVSRRLEKLSWLFTSLTGLHYPYRSPKPPFLGRDSLATFQEVMLMHYFLKGTKVAEPEEIRNLLRAIKSSRASKTCTQHQRLQELLDEWLPVYERLTGKRPKIVLGTFLCIRRPCKPCLALNAHDLVRNRFYGEAA